MTADILKELQRSTALANIRGDSTNFDDYELKQQLGQGAFGKVFLAVHKPTGVQYAVKTYEKRALLDPVYRRGVEREVKILQKLHHPNTMNLHSTISSPNQLHLVLEYVQGQSLSKLLRRKYSKRVSEPIARYIARQVLLALAYLHGQAIAHRDVKPENILVDERMQVKLVDYGLSTFRPNGLPVTMCCGTPHYMAPEVARKEKHLGFAGDMWALGVSLYKMLCGSFPFTGKASKEVFRQAVKGSFTLPKHFSGEVVDLIQKCLVVDCGARITAEQALLEPWVAAPDPPDLPAQINELSFAASPAKTPKAVSLHIPNEPTGHTAPLHKTFDITRVLRRTSNPPLRVGPTLV